MIDFDPPYQRRGGLWSARDKAFLIDSILNQYDIPKLYIADFTLRPSVLNTRSRHYAVIDGKQRFEAISDFVNGKITLASDFVLTTDPHLELGGLGYQDLKKNFPQVASRFDNFNLTVMSVITDEEGKINELFVRLNRNKTLTGPEIRNAMQGVVPELFRKIAADPFFSEKVKFTTTRGQDLDAAAKFLLVEFRGRLVETKRVALDRFVEDGLAADSQVSGFERAAKRVLANLKRMNKVFLPKDPLLSSQGAVVPYYWLIRNIEAERLPLVRPFLVNFDERRKKNRQLANDPATVRQADPTLMTYERFNRSINDSGSLEGRYEILSEAFYDWST
ncbi:DUF262 domain-containing protein [Nocardioides sp. MAHUQ-72]|uniref:DUF262 domain-containing protein n=1 Tax=unclassified Nocardioides TaxID=2615069 RepID=UPI003615C234